MMCERLAVPRPPPPCIGLPRRNSSAAGHFFLAIDPVIARNAADQSLAVLVDLDQGPIAVGASFLRVMLEGAGTGRQDMRPSIMRSNKARTLRKCIALRSALCDCSPSSQWFPLSDPSELAGLLESRLPRPPTKLSQRNRGSLVVASPKRKLDQAWRLR